MMHDCATLQRVSPNRNNACGFGSRLTDRHKARETERALTLQHYAESSVVLIAGRFRIGITRAKLETRYGWCKTREPEKAISLQPIKDEWHKPSELGKVFKLQPGVSISE
ncbi:hypothetical protein TRIUR3_11889 [Triticum urartu]|uniref:Uncharacterized protein n=1 Tax=Triticum urartu TaxID=4572 RepID=M7ZQ66_TRIUA|nr:hypothetical protein TRIUR3_11889 [Triticum urartu]